MTIRKLELSDMDAAASVHRSALLHALPIFEGLHSPEEDRWYFRERVFPVCEVWGAFDECALIGIIAFRHDWIDQLYVLPGIQRRGVGTALLNIARSAYSSLHAWTFQRNAVARSFYESRRFLKIKETDGSDNAEKEPDILYFWSRGAE
jgi:GNAT superfamily N-acetyltransferase